MNRAKSSDAWKHFCHDANEQGYEIITRIGSPIILHKKETPFTPETVWFTYLRKKTGKFSKNQLRGIEIFKALGLKVFKFGKNGHE